MLDSAVVTRSLTYRVGDAELISDVDFDATEGSLTAVIGPNGAGKSTLLNLIAGNLRPSNGNIWLNGIDASSAPAGELALVRSMLTQTAPVDIPFTVIQVVTMGRFPHRRVEANTSERDVAAVTEAMRLTDTTRLANRIYATLSGGERTRVSLARVLAQDTPIVLLDEPTTALDIAHQERIMTDAVELSRQRRSVIVVLHDLNAAAVFADHVVLMNRGVIVATGRPGDVLRQDLLSDVYKQPLVVVEHPFRDCPLVLTAEF